MTLCQLRPHAERRFLERFAIEAIGSESICLPPHINQGTILRAVPINQARQLRTGCLKMLDRLAVAQMAHVMGIYKVKNSLFSRIHDQIGSRNQNGAGTIEVCIDGVKMCMICRRKPIQYFEVGVEFEEAFAKVRAAIPASIAGYKVDVSFCIHGRSLPKLPNTRRLSCRRSIEHSSLLE